MLLSMRLSLRGCGVDSRTCVVRVSSASSTNNVLFQLSAYNGFLGWPTPIADANGFSRTVVVIGYGTLVFPMNGLHVVVESKCAAAAGA